MSARRAWLLGNSIFISAYLAIGSIWYLVEGESLYVDHPIISAFYLIFIFGHIILAAIGILFQWWGFFAKKRGPIIFASIFFFLAGIELFVMLAAPAAMTIGIVINLIAGKPDDPAFTASN